MRKAQLHAKIAALEERNTELRRERDGFIAKLHEKVGNLDAAVARLADKVDGQGRNLTGHGAELAGLAASVRAALKAREAEAKPAEAAPAPQAETVTPIKRGKATG